MLLYVIRLQTYNNNINNCCYYYYYHHHHHRWEWAMSIVYYVYKVREPFDTSDNDNDNSNSNTSARRPSDSIWYSLRNILFVQLRRKRNNLQPSSRFTRFLQNKITTYIYLCLRYTYIYIYYDLYHILYTNTTVTNRCTYIPI